MATNTLDSDFINWLETIQNTQGNIKMATKKSQNADPRQVPKKFKNVSIREFLGEGLADVLEGKKPGKQAAQDTFSNLFAGGPFGKTFEDVFSKQTSQSADNCVDRLCHNHESCGDGNEFLEAVVDHKAIFNRLGVILLLISDLTRHIQPDVQRILSLLNECQNLVDDGNASIEGTGLQI